MGCATCPSLRRALAGVVRVLRSPDATRPNRAAQGQPAHWVLLARPEQQVFPLVKMKWALPLAGRLVDKQNRCRTR